MKQKLLIIEDEKNIARFMELELLHEGFEVTVVNDGREGLMHAQNEQFDCLLIDVMLPSLNGLEICRRIRTSNSVPIILITARDAVMDRVAGLDAGADDYVIKPFAIEELLARIRSLLRRAQVNKVATDVNDIYFRDLVINQQAYTVFCKDKKLELTKTEYDLLLLLIQSANKVCSRELILEKVWGYDTEVETNVIDVYIRHLRSKLPDSEPPYIETVRGVGYVMRK